jgi:uncharacterized protein
MTERYLEYPFRFGDRAGASVIEDADRHLRDKVEAVLFTAPGERVNNPSFGVGLNRAVFEPLDELAIAAVEFRIQQGLRRDIGDEILIDAVTVEADLLDGRMTVRISFRR